MTGFSYSSGRLCCGSVQLGSIAEQWGTPTYVYSAAAIAESYRELDSAFRQVEHRICYSIKANPNLEVCRLLASLGSGADVTSGGELYRALRAGFEPEKIVFAGVGKSRGEMAEALSAGIGLFSVESESELRALSRVAADMWTSAPVSLRVNPDVDPRTHPYITTGLSRNKFGVPLSCAEELYALAASLPGIRVCGVGMHIGSQMMHAAPMVEAAESLSQLAGRLLAAGHELEYLDIGGGYGIAYGDQQPESPEKVAEAAAPAVRELGLTLVTEPGRRLVGAAGALLLRVLYRKRNGEHEFVVTDGGMNALLRPALYGAEHRVLPVAEGTELVAADIVGPVCESADFITRDRPVPDVREGDLLAVMDAGAYGFSMSSEYNGRPRPAEVLVEDGRARLVRRRQSYEEMAAPELV